MDLTGRLAAAAAASVGLHILWWVDVPHQTCDNQSITQIHVCDNVISIQSDNPAKNALVFSVKVK